jgi:hypothetical protein
MLRDPAHHRDEDPDPGYWMENSRSGIRDKQGESGNAPNKYLSVLLDIIWPT